MLNFKPKRDVINKYLHAKDEYNIDIDEVESDNNNIKDVKIKDKKKDTSHVDKRKKYYSLLQYDKNGNFIKEHNNTLDAVYDITGTYKESGINSCLRQDKHYTRSALGFMWLKRLTKNHKIKKKIKPYKNNRFGRIDNKVEIFDKDKKKIRSFNSIDDAYHKVDDFNKGRSLKFFRINVLKSCRDNMQELTVIAYGYYWKLII